MTKDRNFFDLEATIEGAKKEREQRAEEEEKAFNEYLQGLQDQGQRNRSTMADLSKKATHENLDEIRQQRDKEIKEAQERVKQEIIAKYKYQEGLPTERDIRVQEGLSELVRGLELDL